MWRFRTALPLALALVAASASPAFGQRLEVGSGAGVSVPIAAAAEYRDPGPYVHLFAGYRLSRAVEVRGEGSLGWLDGEPHPPSENPPSSASRGDLRISGLTVLLVVTPVHGRVAPYGFFGAGSYGLRNLDGVRGFGRAPGLAAGGGVSVGLRRVRVYGEGRVEMVLSDFGAREWRPTSTVPVAVGVRVPCCGQRAP
jgi:hypothetical protein